MLIFTALLINEYEHFYSNRQKSMMESQYYRLDWRRS